MSESEIVAAATSLDETGIRRSTDEPISLRHGQPARRVRPAQRARWPAARTHRRRHRHVTTMNGQRNSSARVSRCLIRSSAWSDHSCAHYTLSRRPAERHAETGQSNVRLTEFDTAGPISCRPLGFLCGQLAQRRRARPQAPRTRRAPIRKPSRWRPLHASTWRSPAPAPSTVDSRDARRSSFAVPRAA